MFADSKELFPRRDYLILPVLSLLTVLAIVGAVEIGARQVWESREDSSCDLKLPLAGDRYKPNCTSRMKLPEGPWVQSSYNECGYRSEAPCRTKPPNTIRIALLGSSDGEGFLVPYPQAFAGLSEKILTRECGRPVEIQNLSASGIHLSDEAHRVDEALALHPDATIFLITPGNMAMDVDPQWDALNSRRAKPTLGEAYGLRADLLRLKVIARQSTAFSMLRYYYFQNDRAYLEVQLKTYRDLTDILRSPLSPNWQKRFDFLDLMLGYLSDRIHSQGIPFALISSLSRPQAAVLSSRDAFPDLDPFAFDRQVAMVALRRDIPHFKVINDFSRLQQPSRLFYIADGHMNASGHEILAQSVTRQILQSRILQPAGCSATTDSD